MPYKTHKRLQEPEMTQVIWHYFSLSKFLYMIDRSALYLCRHDKFDDSFEGCLTERDKQFVDGYSPEMHKSFEKDRMGCYYSNCWTCSENDEYVLWKSYSSINDGIAVRSTVERLIKSLNDEEREILISNVLYIDYTSDYTFRKTGGDVNTLAPHFSKREYFRSEKELRVMYVEPMGTFQNSPEGIEVKVNLSTLIDKIYVAPFSFMWMAEAITHILEKFDLGQIEVVKSSI